MNRTTLRRLAETSPHIVKLSGWGVEWDVIGHTIFAQQHEESDRTLLANSRCQRRYAPIVVGFIPECRSASLRNQRSASLESSLEG